MDKNARLAFASEFEGTYHFRVLEYRLSLSIMKLQISKLDAEIKKEGIVVLENVQHFSGWFIGSGQVKNGNTMECLRILRRAPRYNNLPDEYLLQQFALFEIVSDEEPILSAVLQNAKFFMQG